MIKKITLAALLCGGALTATTAREAIELDGSSYYLPKTALKFTLITEKTTYTPGEFNQYAERFFKKSATAEEQTTYRIVGIKFSTYGVPDTAKIFTVKIDGKHNITSVRKNESGILWAINDNPTAAKPEAPFVPAPKPAKLNPNEYLTQDILNAGSKAKMAELTAEEIFDIRDSRSRLSKGQADNMPTDGQQLKLMLNSLDNQENALSQLFFGTEEKDTFETVINYIPTKPVNRDVLFRFSKHFGPVGKDDLSGSPYYISVIDEQQVPTLSVTIDKNENKNDAGVWVNLPGKITVKLYQDEKMLQSYEIYSAQFGRTEPINGELFNKKSDTKMILNTVTGNLESIKSETRK